MKRQAVVVATVAQRVNEMKFALRQKGIPAEISDHLDLKAHADPMLSARENIDGFLESHGLAQYNDRELASLANQAEDQHIEHEVAARLAAREAELVAEIKGEGCEDCNTKLKALEARLRARRAYTGSRRGRPGGRRRPSGPRKGRNLKVGSRILKGIVAKKGEKKKRKANPMAKRAMALVQSKGITLKAAWKIVKGGGGGGAIKRTAHRAAKGLKSVSVGDGIEALVVFDGLKDSWDEYKVRQKEGRLKLDHWTIKGVAAPAVDALATAKLIHVARKSPLTSKLAKNIFDLKPLALDLSKLKELSAGEIITGLPSAAGWMEAGRNYRAAIVGPGGGYTPRLAALTGVSVENKDGHLVIAYSDGNLKDSIARSAMAPALVGGAVSYGGDRVIKSGSMPVVVKRVFAIRPLKSA